LSAALFSTTAASAAHPGGILAGVAPLTPTTGSGSNALAGDLKLLAEAITAAGGLRWESFKLNLPLPSHHSITSSARPSSVGGTSRQQSVLAKRVNALERGIA
jgi:hypothetical protein